MATIPTKSSYLLSDPRVERESLMLGVSPHVYGPGLNFPIFRDGDGDHVKLDDLKPSLKKLEIVKYLAEGQGLDRIQQNRTATFHWGVDPLGKSASIAVMALAPDEVRHRVLQRMQKIQEGVVTSNILGKLATRDGITAPGVACTYTHGLVVDGNGKVTPQVHLHTEIYNVCALPNGAVRSLGNARDVIFRDQNTNLLEVKALTYDLLKSEGFNVVFENNQIHIKDFPKEVAKAFSTTSEALREAIQERGGKISAAERKILLQELHEAQKTEITATTKKVPMIGPFMNVVAITKDLKAELKGKGVTPEMVWTKPSPEQVKAQAIEVTKAEWNAKPIVMKALSELKHSFTANELKDKALRLYLAEDSGQQGQAAAIGKSTNAEAVLEVCDLALKDRRIAGVKPIPLEPDKEKQNQKQKGPTPFREGKEKEKEKEKETTFENRTEQKTPQKNEKRVEPKEPKEQQEQRYHTKESQKREQKLDVKLIKTWIKETIQDYKAFVKDSIVKAKAQAKATGEKITKHKFYTKLATVVQKQLEARREAKELARIDLRIDAKDVGRFLLRHAPTPRKDIHKDALAEGITFKYGLAFFQISVAQQAFKALRKPKDNLLNSNVNLIVNNEKETLTDKEKMQLQNLCKKKGSRLKIEGPSPDKEPEKPREKKPKDRPRNHDRTRNRDRNRDRTNTRRPSPPPPPPSKGR